MGGDPSDSAAILPVLLGAGGAVGEIILRGWAAAALPVRPLANRRDDAAADLRWNMTEAPPALPRAGRPVVLNFAGVTPNSARGAMEDNTRLALAGLDAGRRWGAAHVFLASSSAVYAPSGEAAATETDALAPPGAYGRAKAEMERAALSARGEGDPGLTVLRIGNVAGAGEPFRSARRGGGPIPLDRFADGSGPSRCFVGPVTLARTLWRLCEAAASGMSLPRRLNLAAPVPTAMSDILTALGRDWTWRAAPASAVARAHLDTARLQAIAPLPETAGDAETLVAELRQVGGWP